MACYAPVALHSLPINQKQQLQACAVIQGVLEWNELCANDIICPFKSFCPYSVLSGTPGYFPVHPVTSQCLQCSQVVLARDSFAHFRSQLHLAFPSSLLWSLMHSVLPCGFASLQSLMLPNTVLPCGFPRLCSPVLAGHLSAAPTCRLPLPGHFKFFSHVNKDTLNVVLQSCF